MGFSFNEFIDCKGNFHPKEHQDKGAGRRISHSFKELTNSLYLQKQ